MSLDYGFNDKMQLAKDQAQRARNQGASPRSRGRWAKAPPAEDTDENRLYAELADLRRELRDRDNTIAVLRANGGNEPDWDFGHEYDDPPERVGLGLPTEPRSPCKPSTPARTRRLNTMTNKQYLATLKRLHLTPASKHTAEALGVSLRQIQNYASGKLEVPETTAKLLRMYLKHGIPATGKISKIPTCNASE